MLLKEIKDGSWTFKRFKYKKNLSMVNQIALLPCSRHPSRLHNAWTTVYLKPLKWSRRQTLRSSAVWKKIALCSPHIKCLEYIRNKHSGLFLFLSSIPVVNCDWQFILGVTGGGVGLAVGREQEKWAAERLPHEVWETAAASFNILAQRDLDSFSHQVCTQQGASYCLLSHTFSLAKIFIKSLL